MDMHRAIFGLACFVAAAIGASVCLADQNQAPDQQKVGVAQEGTTVVVPLAHADAGSVGAAIERLDLPVNVAVVSDTKLILHGDAEAITKIQTDLIAKIDTPAITSDKLTNAFIPLDRSPDASLIALVRAAAPSRSTRIAVDHTSRLLVIRATQNELESVRKLIETVSKPPASLTVSLFFLRGDIGVAHGNAQPLPEKLAAAGRTLQANGFSNLSLISPIIVAVDEGQRFEQQAALQDGGASDDGNALHFRVKGTARLDSHGKIAQVELEAKVHGGYLTPNGVKQQTLFEMETTLATELGDYVILAASPASSAGGSAIALVVSVSRR